MEILKGDHILPSYRFMKGDKVGIRGKVVCLLFHALTGKLLRITESENIVTNDGDLFYAERGALLTVGSPIGPVPTNFTDANGVPDMEMSLFTSGGAPTKTSVFNTPTTQIGSAKAIDATYPLVNDGDGDNTGAGVDIVTYRVSFTTAEVNGTIDDVVLANPGASGAVPVIQHADGLSVTKTSSDTLKVFVNHEMLGV